MKPIVRLLIAGAAALTMFAPRAAPQGGPPFISDDPDTPGPGHWEINLGFLGSRNPYLRLLSDPGHRHQLWTGGSDPI